MQFEQFDGRFFDYQIVNGKFEFTVETFVQRSGNSGEIVWSLELQLVLSRQESVKNRQQLEYRCFMEINLS